MTNLVLNRPTEDAAAQPPPRASGRLVAGIGLGLLAVVLYAVATGNGVYALGAIGFVVALLVSVTLHEGGHFWTARRFGMKATQFFVGFGPTLWSRQRGETEWGVKAIPAGGFVKIVGMTSLEEVAPEDESRAFWKQPAGQRVVVLAAGSTVHFLIAIALVLGSSLVIGKTVERSPALGSIASCVTASAGASCDAGGALPSPAEAAGLLAGDVVTAVDGVRVDSVLAFIEKVRAAPGRDVALTVERDGTLQQLTLTPTPVLRASLDDPDVTARVGAIGVALQPRASTAHVNPVEAVQNTGTVLKLMVTGTIDTLTKKIGTITQVYGPNRDPEGFIGVVGAGRVSGEVLASQETVGVKLLSFLLIIASLNLFVGVFNLLPLLPLDGGHIAVLLYEQARDKVKRVFGYSGELRRVDLNKLLPITYGVVLLFATFTVWLLGADLVNPIRIG